MKLAVLKNIMVQALKPRRFAVMGQGLWEGGGAAW